MASRVPLSGYNHNVRYGNRVYHVQTEDSGEDAPHIFTHLFLSGTVIASARTDYDELVGTPGADEKVRKQMQEQHKRLMKQLRRGEFDEKIVSLVGSIEPVAEGEAAGPAPAAAVLVTPGPDGVSAEVRVSAEALAAPAVPAEVTAEVPAEVDEAAGAPAEVPAAGMLGQTAVAPAAVEAATVPLQVEGEPAEETYSPFEQVVAPIDLPEDEGPVEVEMNAVAAQQLTAALQAEAAEAVEVPEVAGPAELEVPEATEPSAGSREIVAVEALPPSPRPDLPVAVERDLDDLTVRTSIPVEAQPATEQAPSDDKPTIPLRAPEAPRRPRRISPPVQRAAAPPFQRVLAPPQRARPVDQPGGREPLLSQKTEPELHVEVTERMDAPGHRVPRPPTGRTPQVPPPIPRDAPFAEVAPRAARASLPALPRIARPTLPTPDDTSVIVDRPPEGEAAYTEKPGVLSPTFYSQVRRRQEAEQAMAAATDRGSGLRPSRGVFSTPLPGASYPARSDNTPLPDSLQPRHSGVYPVPGVPPSRPPHPDPSLRAPGRPAYGSTPQRYTAPSRGSGNVTLPKRKSPTGTYERPGAWGRTPPGVTPAPAARPGVSVTPSPTRPGTTTPAPGPRPPGGAQRLGTPPSRPPGVVTPLPHATPRQVRPPSQPRGGGAPPEARGRPRPPSTPPASASRSPSPLPVVARPAVIINQPQDISMSRGRPAATPPPLASRAPHPVAPQPGRAPTPPHAPRAVERGAAGIFGSDLITERSLDEVILSYLAEDVESSDE